MIRELLAQTLMVQCTGPYDQCTLCDFLKLLDNVKNVVVYSLSAVVGAMLLYGAFIMMTAAGNSTRFTRGRVVIYSALIGFLIVISAYFVVGWFMRTFLPGAPLPWNRIQC